jgi:hypothetical protein
MLPLVSVAPAHCEVGTSRKTFANRYRHVTSVPLEAIFFIVII